jgi:transcription initiation factor TFIID subunit 5
MSSSKPAAQGKLAGDEPRKKRVKKEVLITIPTKCPMPPPRDSDKRDRAVAQKEAALRRKLTSENLPSICMYTIFNAKEAYNTAALCSTISEDSSMIAIGFSDSTVRVWALTPENLKQLREPHELEELDKEAEDISKRMLDDEKTFDTKTLCGHSGPVYGVSFSPDRQFLLSCSEDNTIRLWSLQTWTNVCVYKSHCYPVWNVEFCPHGYYFASCSFDRTARVWATEHHQPLRVYVGHADDVDLVKFHPSSNYLATGSSDSTIMLWDVIDGSSLKTLTGHEGRITSMAFSVDGKFLVSTASDRKLLVWEHNVGHKLAEFELDTATMSTMAFSRCGAILTSGSLDDRVYVWDFSRLLDEIDTDDLSVCSAPKVFHNVRAILLASYRTKSTSLLNLSFTRRNLLLAAGVSH